MASVNWTDKAIASLDDIHDYLRREVICQSYRIIYWLASDTEVNILGVLHGSRDLSRERNQPWEAH